MRIRPRLHQTPYLSRRHQLRMLGLVLALSVVLIGYAVATNSRLSAWLFPNAPTNEPTATALRPSGRPDFHVRGETDNLPPGAFRSPTEPNVTEPNVTEPPVPAEQPVQDATRPSAPLEPSDPRIDKELLAGVRDNTLGVRHDEAEAFYRILAHARDLPAQTMTQAARTDLVYTHLMVEPDRYRGELVTVVGDARRITEFTAGPNHSGIERLYEAWVFTADSGTHPFRVVFTRLPKDVHPAESLDLPVRVTGYFFKREGYNTPGGLHVAPVLLAKRLQRNSVEAMPTHAASLTPYLLGAVLLVGGGLGVMLWRFRSGDRRFRREQLQSLLAPAQPQELGHLETRDIDDELRRLAEE